MDKNEAVAVLGNLIWVRVSNHNRLGAVVAALPDGLAGKEKVNNALLALELPGVNYMFKGTANSKLDGLYTLAKCDSIQGNAAAVEKMLAGGVQNEVLGKIMEDIRAKRFERFEAELDSNGGFLQVVKTRNGNRRCEGQAVEIQDLSEERRKGFEELLCQVEKKDWTYYEGALDGCRVTVQLNDRVLFTNKPEDQVPVQVHELSNAVYDVVRAKERVSHVSLTNIGSSGGTGPKSR